MMIMIDNRRLIEKLILFSVLLFIFQISVYGQDLDCINSTIGMYDTRKNGLGGVCVAINTNFPICNLNNSIWEIVACRSQGFIGVNVSVIKERKLENNKIIYTSCMENEINLTNCIHEIKNRSYICNGVTNLICQQCISNRNCTDNNINSVCRDGRCRCQEECMNGGYCYNNTCICPEGFNGDACIDNNIKLRGVIIYICAVLLFIVIIIIISISALLSCCYYKSKIKKISQIIDNVNFYSNNNDDNNVIHYEEDFYAMVRIENENIECNQLTSPLENNITLNGDNNIILRSRKYTDSNIYSTLGIQSSTTSYPFQTSITIATTINNNNTSTIYANEDTSNIVTDENCDRYITIENELYDILEPDTFQVKREFWNFYGIYNTIHGVGINDAKYSSITVKPSSQSIPTQVTRELKDNYTNLEGTYYNECPEYWKPHYKIDEILNQMAENKFKEILHNSLTLENSIGSGEFGNVYKAQWNTSIYTNEILPVAVKILKNDSNLDLQTSFIKEAAVMGQFNHPNILRLLGVVSQSLPYMIVTELMQTQLLQFISSAIKKIPTLKTPKVQQQVSVILLKFTREIASGMRYLSSKKFIHRDLAARNILIGKELICRIADFGMSRELRQDSEYYKSHGGVIPLRWCAPEAVFFKHYTEKSDVWSFGMTLYEIWTLGEKPWYSYSLNEVVIALEGKDILSPPAGCPRAIYSIMVETWNPNPNDRIDFESLVNILSGDEVQLLHKNIQNSCDGDNTSANNECYLIGSDPNTAFYMYRDVHLKYSIH